MILAKTSDGHKGIHNIISLSGEELEGKLILTKLNTAVVQGGELFS
jgi:hypothetical protein